LKNATQAMRARPARIRMMRSMLPTLTDIAGSLFKWGHLSEVCTL
jgi:hypothetical protein